MADPIDTKPTSITIGPISYRLQKAEDLRSDQGANLYGQISFSECRIKIDENYWDHQRTPFILWHEVIHAILEHAGIEEHDEKLINILSYGIVDALRKNEVLRCR